MKIYISGGAKNGKSSYAQALAVFLSGRDGAGLYYLATMRPHDSEDRVRIARHVSNRAGLGFVTAETPGCAALDAFAGGGVCLLDSVTALLLNEMYPPTHDGAADKTAPDRVAASVLRLSERVPSLVCVSDYIFSDAVRYDEFTEDFRRGLARIDAEVSAKCDAVYEVCAGTIAARKGKLIV